MTAMRLPRRPIVALASAVWLVAMSVGLTSAADPSTPPAGPPFAAPVPGQTVYDPAGALQPITLYQAQAIIDAAAAQADVEIVVYTQVVDGADVDRASADAQALLDQWAIGKAGGDRGVAIVLDLDPSLDHGDVGIASGTGFGEGLGSAGSAQAVARGSVQPYLDSGDPDSGLLIGLARIYQAVTATAPGSELTAASQVPPGPPFPNPETDRAVYDYAGILSPETIVKAESTIDAIEARTGAEVVVYTQDSGEYPTTEETEQKARALIDQWGIGRAGFDDGMVIFFDMQPNLEHGQVQLYAAPGFEAAYLSNSERQSIFDDDMLPYLKNASFDSALSVALDRIDAAATPEHAASLQQARQFNAVLGLVGAPIVFMGLSGWALFSWRRFGKDPVYLDDPSILLPAPPPDLTAASGALIMDGATSRRALTTAMLDLASRGLIAFREEHAGLLRSRKVGIDVEPTAGDPEIEAQRTRNQRRPTGPAEDLALRRLRTLGKSDAYIEPDDLPKFGAEVADFDKALEQHVVGRGWFGERPSTVVSRWFGRGVVAIIIGVIGLVIGFNVPISGLTLIGGAAIAGGIVVAVTARSMPAVTMPGAMIRAMLAAYRRTLQKTMAQARSMQQVVDEAGLEWLDTPDQAVVWGTALGLQSEIEDVLSRSMDDVKAGRSAGTTPYFPAWYQTSSGSSFMSSAAAGSGGSLFSGSGIPDIGGMMSALGTIGDLPSSSGGGGGFSGGSSGGGGGGAGGGF